MQSGKTREPSHQKASGGASAAHLHAGVRLVHELEQLVDDRLEELPVRTQEARVLPHHVPAARQPATRRTTRGEEKTNTRRSGAVVWRRANCACGAGPLRERRLGARDGGQGAHMMLEAMTALLSLPRVTSHRLSRSLRSGSTGERTRNHNNTGTHLKTGRSARYRW